MAELQYLYKGTEESYWLDKQSLDKCMMYLHYGRECQVKEARILLSVVAEALSGKRGRRIPEIITADQPVDRAALYKQYPELRDGVVRR